MDNVFKISGIKKNTKICKIEDLEEDKAFVKRGEDKYLPGIIVYKNNNSIYIWLNNCPHAHLTLDIVEGRVQSGNNDLLCANHGAKFDPITGKCIRGPCKNSFLESFPFKIKNNYVLAG